MKNKSMLVDLPEVGTVISTAYRYPKTQEKEFKDRVNQEKLNHPKYVSNGSTDYSFHVAKNSELLIMLINSKHSDPTVPINYIYAGQMVDDKFDGFYKFLKEMGYEDFETRDKSPKSPKDESDTIRTVVKGYDVWGGEQLRGVIVNPSYPWAPGHPGPQFLNRRGRLSSLLTALAAGAVLATLVSRLGRNQ